MSRPVLADDAADVSTRLDEHDAVVASEARLSAWYARFSESEARLRQFVLSDPVAAARAVRDTLALPREQANPSTSPEGEVLRAALTRRAGGLLPVARVGACLVRVPDDPSEYSAGAHRQTLRRKVRAAQKAGVRTRLVTDPDERRRLVDRLDEAWRTKSDERYRRDTSSEHLLGASLWMVAVDQHDEPLVLAVTPVDGPWSLLQCFVSLGESRAHSDARYLLTQALVEQLSALGVSCLVDTRAAVELTSGLRQFQRIVGFRIARIRVLGARASSDAGAGAPSHAGGRAAEQRSSVRRLAA